MNQEEKELISAMEDGQKAELVLSELNEWFDVYQHFLIEKIKQCHSSELEQARCLLKAADDFKSYLTSAVNNGKIAEADFKFQQEIDQQLNSSEFYPE